MRKRKNKSKDKRDESASKRVATLEPSVDVEPTEKWNDGDGAPVNYEPPLFQEQEHQEHELQPRKVHPLLIPLILEKIFGYALLSPNNRRQAFQVAKDGCNFRLVCKVWKKSATKIFRLTEGVFLFIGRKKEDIPLSSEIERFQNTMKDTILPVRRYKLNLKVEREKKPLLELESFMTACATEAVQLRIDIDQFSDFQEILLPSYYYGIPFKFDELEKLSIYCTDFGFNLLSPMKYKVPLLLQATLAGAKNLKEFEFTVWRDITSQQRDLILLKLSVAEVFRQLPTSIKKLRMEVGFWSNCYFTALSKSNLMLEEFQLSAETIFGYYEPINDFFKGQSDTLKKLFLGTKPGRLFPEGLSPLRNLQSLTLNVGEDYQTLLPFLRQKFPSLTKLSLNLSEVPWAQIEKSWLEKKEPNLLVQELVMPADYYPAKFIKLIPQIFPNVKILHVSRPSNIEKCLQQIFSHCGAIEELHIRLTHWQKHKVDGDAILSGIPAKECSKLRKEGFYGAVEHSGLQRKPCILNLECLKRLHVENNCKATFSDLSFYIFLSDRCCVEELYWETMLYPKYFKVWHDKQGERKYAGEITETTSCTVAECSGVYNVIRIKLVPLR